MKSKTYIEEVEIDKQITERGHDRNFS